MTVAIVNPWSAISRSGTTLRLAPNKVYDLSAPFANQLTVNQTELLSGPILLKVKVALGYVISSVNTTSDFITIGSNLFATADPVKVRTSVTLPAPLDNTTTYYYGIRSSTTGYLYD